MYYIIQENLFKEYNFNNLLEYLKRYGLEYEIIKFRPFVNELEFNTDRKDVFFFGSINGANVAQQYGWNPGHVLNENFDFEIYSKHWDMLNSDAKVINFGEKDVPDYFFARPTKDTKTFSGQMFTREDWLDYTKTCEDSNLVQQVSNETRVVISSPKTIQQEIRCWIIDGKLVTCSQYKIGSRVNMMNMDNNEEAVIFAEEQARKFSLAKAFVLDICLHEDEYKVVEAGCINCAGFYDGNMSKLIQALEETFKTKEYV